MLYCIPSPPGHDEELMDVEISLKVVSLGLRYASNRFLLTSRAKSRRNSGSLSSSKGGMVGWLAEYEGHANNWSR